MISRTLATIAAVLSGLLTLSRRTIPTRHRILHWELPRLLSAIERLDIALRRDLASDALYGAGANENGNGNGNGDGAKDGDGGRMKRYRVQAIRNDLSLVVTQAERIRAILGYDSR